MNGALPKGRQLFQKIRGDFIGLNTQYRVVSGETSTRVYLDSTATTLMMKVAHDVMEDFYKHYANTHSLLHFGAKISTKEYAWAHRRILAFMKADPEVYTCFFTGSGTTAGMNRLARVLRDIRPDKNVAVVSIMEHHSNDLPHRKHMKEVDHIPLNSRDGKLGCVCLESLEKTLQKNEGRVNYVAMTGVSNVTGIVNPINEAAEVAHRYGALFIVDGAQLAAHVPVTMSVPDNPEQNIDALVFSGHKTYVPGSPGAVIARKDLLEQIEPEEVGGGMVEDVFVDRYVVKETFPDREEAGTPNIPGAVGLAAAMDVLDRISMELLRDEETQLINSALDQLMKIEDVVIYGETDTELCDRVASISFNITGLDHGLVAAVLNDYFNVAVRNDCFCAHPYVKEMIMDDLLDYVESVDMKDIEQVYHLKRGMVRASFALYSTEEDVAALIIAVKDIASRKDYYQSQYEVDSCENYVHKSFCFDHTQTFSVEDSISVLVS
jgi:selenocysteine lyase/cysteine desulfurase